MYVSFQAACFRLQYLFDRRVILPKGLGPLGWGVRRALSSSFAVPHKALNGFLYAQKTRRADVQTNRQGRHLHTLLRLATPDQVAEALQIGAASVTPAPQFTRTCHMTKYNKSNLGVQLPAPDCSHSSSGTTSINVVDSDDDDSKTRNKRKFYTYVYHKRTYTSL